MDVCTLASGSSGNSVLVTCGNTRVLIDAGISARRITTSLKQMGIAPESLTAVFITHEHSDHIAGLTTLTKQLRLPVYATAATLAPLCNRIPILDGLIQTLTPGQGFELQDLWVEPFATPHDSAGSVGYSLQGDGVKMALATDLGHLTPEILQAVMGADLMVAETNHDEDWVRSGPYPYYLKQRILGDFGHLSNETGAELVFQAVESGARTVLLAHLSNENNVPARARQVVAQHLSARGIDPERDITLKVAPRAEPGTIYQVMRGADTKAFHLKGATLC